MTGMRRVLLLENGIHYTGLSGFNMVVCFIYSPYYIGQRL